MQEINYERIERLEVRDGEPVFDPPPTVLRLFLFGKDNGPNASRGNDGFALKKKAAPLNGWSDKTIQFLFNDLDPSDAVDFKRLLIELYDRKLISRSSLQLKMDLDPDIEAANRENERKSVDLLDEKQVKPIVDMVMAGIMSVETAQEMLGLDPAKNTPGGKSEASWGGPFAQAVHADAVCDDCAHFEEESNLCRVQRSGTTFDTPACRFFDSGVASTRIAPRPDDDPSSVAACRECGS